MGFRRMKGRHCGVLAAGLIVPRCAVAKTSGGVGVTGPPHGGERRFWGGGNLGPSRGVLVGSLGGKGEEEEGEGATGTSWVLDGVVGSPTWHCDPRSLEGVAGAVVSPVGRRRRWHRRLQET